MTTENKQFNDEWNIDHPKTSYRMVHPNGMMTEPMPLNRIRFESIKRPFDGMMMDSFIDVDEPNQPLTFSCSDCMEQTGTSVCPYCNSECYPDIQITE